MNEHSFPYCYKEFDNLYIKCDTVYLLLGFGCDFGCHPQFWIWTFINICVIHWYFEK